jgi:energy-converting hydrogenase Eha subunit A
MRNPGSAILTVISVICASLPLAAQDQPKRETYAVTVFGTAGATAGKSVTGTVIINDYSSDAEVNELAGILKAKGQDALVSAMDKLKEKGRIALTGTVGNQVQVVRERPGPKGRHIILVANRQMSLPELWNSGRSTNYKFSIVVLDVNAEGKGDGLVYYAVKLKYNKNGQLELEHYGQAPGRIAQAMLMK